MDWGNLPGEMIEEIFSWVPAKSLAQFQSTSKHWQTLLKSESFAKKHSANAPEDEDPLSIMLIDYKVFLVKINLHDVKVAYQFNLKDTRYNSSQVAIRNVFHCDGLLLCTTKDKRLVVWNPCSGETTWIKPRDIYKKSDFYALGYDFKSSCKQYKILRVDRHDVPLINEYEIYDFTSNSWRIIGVATDWFLPLYCPGIAVKGNTYWVAIQAWYSYNHFLLSFDFSAEKFQSLSLPRPFSDSISALSVVRENRLCMFGTSHIYSPARDLRLSETTCWVENSLGSVVSWSKFLTAKVDSEINIHGLSFLADVHNKTVVYCNQSMKNNKIVHILRGNTDINVDPLDRNSTIRPSSSSPLLLNYVPSLVQIKNGTRMKEQRM